MSLKINPICLNCSLFLVSLLFFQLSIHAQPDFGSADGILQRNQKALGNEMVIMVYKDGKIIHQKETGTDFNAKTQAPIGEASQWLTAALVMQFVDEGKISLDDPVSKYLPVFKKYMKNYVTIRGCLTHTTGIESDKFSAAKMTQHKKYASLEELVDAYAAKEISGNAGTEFHYGNIGPAIAGRVLEVITKKAFDRLIMEKLLRPLKMRATSFMDENGYAPNPADGARSTANDYINFLSMLVSNGMFEGKRILSEQAIEEMFTPQLASLPVKYAPKATEGFHYGLGVWIQEENGNGKATTLSCPSLTGTWPYVDRCRHYAALIFVKSVSTEQKKDYALQFKTAVDDIIGACN